MTVDRPLQTPGAALALPIGQAADGFAVIETFGWDTRRFVRLWDHLARLARTCAALGIPFDAGDVLVRLDALAMAGPARIRVTVSVAGQVAVAQAPLGSGAQEWRVMLAGDRLWSGDPWLAVKTTRRGLYDRVRAALPAGVDEALFVNERGEVCEGTITNLFFDAGQGLCTPPLSGGLLPGILRAEKLAQGAREAVLPREALGDVQLWVGNSLRGMIPARLVTEG